MPIPMCRSYGGRSSPMWWDLCRGSGAGSTVSFLRLSGSLIPPDPTRLVVWATKPSRSFFNSLMSISASWSMHIIWFKQCFRFCLWKGQVQIDVWSQEFTYYSHSHLPDIIVRWFIDFISCLCLEWYFGYSYNIHHWKRFCSTVDILEF